MTSGPSIGCDSRRDFGSTIEGTSPSEARSWRCEKPHLRIRAVVGQAIQPMRRWLPGSLIVPGAMIAAAGLGVLAAVDARYAVRARAAMVAPPAAGFQPQLLVYL